LSNIIEDTIKIVKHSDPEPVHSIGDICVPKEYKEYFRKATSNYYWGKRVYPLYLCNQNTWKALTHLGIDIFPIYHSMIYRGAYSENYYYYVIPIYIFTDNPKTYAAKVESPYKEVWDQKIYLDEMRPCYEEGFFINSIQKTLLGHCYSHTQLPHDGSCELHDSVMELSNGEEVGVKIWVWFQN
jgi:hypothetical protein